VCAMLRRFVIPLSGCIACGVPLARSADVETPRADGAAPPSAAGPDIWASNGREATQSDAPAHDPERAGRIAPEIVQSVVRHHFDPMRVCYEWGMRKDPNLSGRVTTKFVIEADGSVSSATDGGSNLIDSQVIACVLGAFRRLTFPPPQGGKVVVVYPIQFNPGP
jgi:hypothetical protein